MNRFRIFASQNKAALIIAIILFIIPFFWLPVGQIDLGGDDNRLYFYDPISYMQSTNLYTARIEGKGTVEPRYYELPYVGLIFVLKLLLVSPTFVVSVINGLKLAGAFLSIYLIVNEFIHLIHLKKSTYKNFAAMLAGLFYVVSLWSTHVSLEWNRALTTHNQVFLNPLIFYLLFKFILTRTYMYLWVALLISFIFAPNFSYTAAPPFFAFFPMAFLFLIMFIRVFLKKPIPWKGICIGLVLFIGIQSFHLFSQVASLFDSSSDINAGVFKKTQEGQSALEYFSAIAPQGMTTLNLFLPSADNFFRNLSLASPLVIIVGLLLNKKREILYIAVFFLLTLFLVSANITDIGIEFYKNLFQIPVFSMFRVFFVKWIYIFLFFYSLLFGLCAYNIILKLKPLYIKLFSIIVFINFIAIGIPLFLGWPVNKSIIRGSNNLKTAMKMDPAFENTLQFVRSLPDDGKILVFPLSDFNYQLMSGMNGGAYEGAPILRHLTTKYGFYGDRNFGWQDTDPAPYTEIIKKYAKEKKYEQLTRLFMTLNIRYIFHNSDSTIYEKNFTRFEGPYTYIKSSFPTTQKEYHDFIQHFPVTQIYKNGPYLIYQIDKSFYNSTIFIPSGIYVSDTLSFNADKKNFVFINEQTCKKQELMSLCSGRYKKPQVEILFSMINPTLYKVSVRQKKPFEPFILVMQHGFHTGWKLMSDNQIIAEDTHIPVDGYANGWLLTSKDIPQKETYTFFIKLDQQKYFLYGWLITGISLGALLILGMVSFIRKQDK